MCSPEKIVGVSKWSTSYLGLNQNIRWKIEVVDAFVKKEGVADKKTSHNLCASSGAKEE